MPYPDNFSPSAYAARWDNPAREDDDAEGRYLAGAFFTHGIPLLVALQSAEFSDNVLNDLCHALSRALENGMDEIKRRGDL
jgi:hypothetical protein